MTIDNRLHHAARELHEVPIEVPPIVGLSTGHTRRSRLPTVAVSLLMVLGGVAAWGGVSNAPSTQSDVDISSAAAVATASVDGRTPGSQSTVDVPSIGPREEIALISSLANNRSTGFFKPPAGVV